LVDVGATLYGHKQSWESSMPIGGEVFIDAEKKVVYGYNSFKGSRTLIKPWKVYFYAVFDTPFSSYGTWNDSIKYDGNKQIAGNEIGAYLNFTTKQSQQVYVKVGISMVGIDKAQQNVEKELQGWNFEEVKSKANLAWEKELSKIEVSGI